MITGLGSLLAGIPSHLSDELFETLVAAPGFRLERIVSMGQATPPGEWLDQEHEEWVLLVGGAAVLVVEGQTEPLKLVPGDTLLLPARCRHRVEWTPADQPTVWLALHYPTPPIAP